MKKEEDKSFVKTQPYDEEAELSVLGSIFLEPDSINIAISKLQEEDFFVLNYRLIFKAMKELHANSTPIDVVTVKNKLVVMGELDRIGGVPTLGTVVSSVGSSVNIRHYISIVEEKSVLRRLIKTSGEISKLSYEGQESITEIMNRAEKNISDIMKNRHTDEFYHIQDIVIKSVDRIEKLYESKGKLTGLETGFIDFDEKTAGLQKSDLILIAARPSMGKTAFALNIAQHVAIKNEVPVALFSLEMSREQLVNRMLCSEAMIDAQKLRTGKLDEQDWEDLAKTIGPLSKAPIYIDDTAGISPMDIRSKCSRLKMENDIGLIVIDYLQLMSGNGRTDSRQQEISEISRSLKLIAREIDVPIIALSQLSRACEQRADHRPILSDLRDSGAIEQDADIVAFLYRDEYYFPDSEKKNQAELIISKQRNGSTGVIDLAWLGQYTKFGNLSKDKHYRG